MRLLYAAVYICIILPFFSFSQEKSSYVREKQSINIHKTNAAVKIDGVIDEIAWKEADVTSKFHQLRPYDSSFAILQTEVKVTFDSKNLYISAKCFQPRESNTTSSLKRDFEAGSTDVFTVSIDTFKDRLNGFQFSITPLNVQREGLIVLGDIVENYWDNKWYSAVKNYDDYWMIEMSIPFKSIRYKVEPENIWGINFGRSVLKYNEITTWSPVPRNFRPSNLAYAGDLIWANPPPNPGANISLIPYVSGSAFVDYPRNTVDLKASPKVKDYNSGIGLDAKIAITPSLNLDLTINPDFSQVEVDKQQTNLGRFELFFPERRQFFLENSDLFGSFGFPETRPFFSRRIGIARNPISGNNQQVRILAGARLSGKLNNNLRIGLLNTQTQEINFGFDKVLPSANYTVATVQQKVFSRSTISGVFVNKSLSLNNLSESQKAGHQSYNRVGGLEFNYFSKNNRVESKTYYHQSFRRNLNIDATSVAQFLGYHHPHLNLNLGVSRVGKNFQADVGFVPRTGYYSISWPIDIVLNPKNANLSRVLNAYGIGLFQSQTIFDLKGKLLDSKINPYIQFSGPAGNSFYTGVGFLYTYLFNEFDPTNSRLNPDPDTYSKVKPLPIGGYSFGNFFLGYESSRRNNFSGKFTFDTGKFYNGKATNFAGAINFRVQPIGVFSIDYAYNSLNLPKPYNQVKYWLIGPKAEISFSKTLFFSNFLQYNTQTNNFNINSRLQWRFKSVSDMFLVYTDNRFSKEINKYNVNAFEPKNRALVFKLTYWLNV